MANSTGCGGIDVAESMITLVSGLPLAGNEPLARREKVASVQPAIEPTLHNGA